MVRFVLGSVALQLGLTACSPHSSAAQRTAEAWRGDLQHIAGELPARHANAFHTTSREQFAAAVKELDAAIPALNDDQVLVGLMRLVALVGDGHTHLDPSPGWGRYPIELAWFGSELRVIAAAEPYGAVVGAQVTGIGGVELDSAIALASDLVPRGENDRRTRLTVTILLTSPRVLHGLGLSASGDRADFEFALGGEAFTQALSLPQAAPTWRFATEQPPLWLRRLAEPWWSEVLPDAKTVYLSFSRYPAEAEFEQCCRKLGGVLDQSAASRIIIDLRRNGGGDFTLVRRFLLPMLKARPTLNRAGGVYAIIGPVTFSASMVNALDLKRELGATLVGEPTGARPNSYSEHGEFQLPNSRLRVSYSTRHYQFGADSATAVEPDQHIEPTWSDFCAGRDGVLEWILAQPND